MNKLKSSKLSIIIVLVALIGGGLGVVNFITDSWILIILSNANLAPKAVQGHTTVLNQVNNTLVVFGGNDIKDIANNNLTKYDLVNDAWLSVNATGIAPLSRTEHASVVTQTNVMYVFGGRSNKTVYNDLYKYDLVRDSWSQVTFSGNAPTARYGHSGILYSLTNELVFWGGKDASGNVMQEIVKFDFVNKNWTIIPFNTPAATYYHTAVLTTGNHMVVFGGINASETYVNTISFYDVENDQWLNITTNSTSAKVSGRANHGSIVTPLNQMLVFGGRTAKTSATGQILKYDFVFNSWEEVNVEGYGPDARWGSTATVTLFNTMMVFGGQTSTTFFNDIFKYNIMSSVLRSSSDGVVLVVLLTIVCSMIIGLCFALDLMSEKNENERLERLEKEAASGKDGAALKKIKTQKKERQPLFETF